MWVHPWVNDGATNRKIDRAAPEGLGFDTHSGTVAPHVVRSGDSSSRCFGDRLPARALKILRSRTSKVVISDQKPANETERFMKIAVTVGSGLFARRAP